MTTFGYTRVSTVEQGGDRSSIEDQKRRIQGVLMINGQTDAQFFCDIAVSGSIPLASRPNGGQMVEQLQRGDTIIAAKLDRLFRSASDALATVEHFQKLGVDVVLVDMGIEPVTSSGVSKLFFTMLAAFAEFEKGRILERMSDGRKAKRKRSGHIGGQAPYGYRIVGKGRDAMLEPVDAEQFTIAYAKKVRAQGLSFRRMAEHLATMDMLNRTGRPFDAMQIKRMLEFYPQGTIAA